MKAHSILLTAGLFVAASAAAADDPAAAAYRDGYRQILEEEWDDAVAVFDGLLTAHPNSEWSDDAAFWRCYARDQGGVDSEEAFACFSELERRWPSSEWLDDARRNLVDLAHRLAREGKPEYRQKVRGYADDSGSEDLLAVLVALAEIGDERSLEVILRRLEGARDEHLRASIVEVLEDVESPAVTAKLGELVRSDPSQRVRQAALETLSWREDSAALEILRAIAFDASQPTALRATAVEALADGEAPGVADDLVRLARDGDGRVARTAIEALGDLDDRASLDALSRLYESLTDASLRRSVLEAIGDREDGGAATLALLRRAASDVSDPEMALAAVAAIGDLESAAAFAELRRLAADASAPWRVRAAAISALGDQESESAVAALAEIASEVEDRRLRLAAVDALAWGELDSAVDVLVVIARQDPDAEVRRQATRSLGELGSARAREALIQLLEQGNQE